jgi:Glutathione-dependent formaldehyde-activating enzyme
MATRTATCSCRKLRVTCAGDPIRISVCHCLECQRRTGSTYGIAAFFARTDVEANGDFRTYRRGSDSGFVVNLTFVLIAALQFFGSWSGDPMRLPLRWDRSPILHSLRPHNRSTTSSVTPGCRP